MKYDDNLVGKICEELKKVPNIKYVAKKVGIDRSTLYRWRLRHHLFDKEMTDAIAIGRESINDSAESVIINGVQNGDIKCATYWLSHNHERYIAVERVSHHRQLEKEDIEFVRRPIPEDANFDKAFDYYFSLESMHGEKIALKKVKVIVDFLCHDDKNLIDIFYAALAEFKKKINNYDEKVRKAADDNPLTP